MDRNNRYAVPAALGSQNFTDSDITTQPTVPARPDTLTIDYLHVV